MTTADLAILGVTVVGLANAYWNWRVQMKVADRLRIVNPAKQPVPKDEPAPPAPSLDALLNGQQQETSQ